MGPAPFCAVHISVMVLGNSMRKQSAMLSKLFKFVGYRVHLNELFKWYVLSIGVLCTYYWKMTSSSNNKNLALLHRHIDIDNI